MPLAPNTELMSKYGTAVDQGMPTALRIAAAILGFGLLMGERTQRKGAEKEAETLREIARLMEEERMRSTIEALHKKGHVNHLAMDVGRFMAKVSAVNTGLEKLASGRTDLTELEYSAAIHHFLEKLGTGGPDSLTEMEKEAFGALAIGGGLRSLGQSLMAGAGKARAALPSLRRGAPTGPVSAATGTPLKPMPSMRGAGPAGPMPASATPTLGYDPSKIGKLSQPPTLTRGTTRAATPTSTVSAGATPQAPVGPMTAPAAWTKTAPATRGAPAAKPAAKAAPAAAAPGIAETTQAAGKGGGGLGWKGKLLVGGALAGGGYATLQAARSARDYMMVPSTAHPRWGAGARPRATVSSYGY